jgi:hypothetical protein
VSRRAIEEFGGILSQVIHESRHNQHQLRISTQKTVEDPLATIRSFNRQFQLTKNESEAVEKGWETEPGNTMFAVINAYTRAAQAVTISNEERNKLERVGGRILALTN